MVDIEGRLPFEGSGLFGVFRHANAARLTYLGLYALQHRGQDSAGIACSSGTVIDLYKDRGSVAAIFSDTILAGLPGSGAIGHVRSSRSHPERKDIQPIVSVVDNEAVAIAHNGQLLNGDYLRQLLERSRAVFQSTTSTEVILHLIAASNRNAFEDRIVDALTQVRGAYSLLFLTKEKLIAVRDPHGVHPLVLGKISGGYVVCSESCALDITEGSLIRDIAPGELLVIDEFGVHSSRPFLRAPIRFCMLEYASFARPNSLIGGVSVYDVRKALGRQLARECPANAEIVIPLPDSGVPAALGYAAESRLPFEMGLVRNRYAHGSQTGLRHKFALNAVRDVVEGKRVIVIDDSITPRAIISMLRDAGAREVHVRISSPVPYLGCVYENAPESHGRGGNAAFILDDINTHLASDSVGCLSLAGLRANVPDGGYCDACIPRDCVLRGL